MIDGTTFDNVDCWTSSCPWEISILYNGALCDYYLDYDCNLIVDELDSCDISITDSSFRNFEASIYRSSHHSLSYIDLDNITVETHGVYSDASDTNGDYAVFYFGHVDVVTINNLIINYKFDLDAYCTYSYWKWLGSDNTYNIQKVVLLYWCYNPVVFIHSYGQLEMENVRLNVNIR